MLLVKISKNWCHVLW